MSLIGVNTFLFRGNLCHKRLSFELQVSKLYKLSFSFGKSDKYALTNRLSLIKVILMMEDFFPFVGNLGFCDRFRKSPVFEYTTKSFSLVNISSLVFPAGSKHIKMMRNVLKTWRSKFK